jgi:hypothetical protein
MATTVDITTNYVGEVAGGYFLEMVKEANTISDNLIRVIPNVPQNDIYLRRMNTTDEFVDYSCGFTPTGDVDIDEKKLTLKKIKSDKEICKEDFRQLWTAAEMGFSAFNDNGLPSTEQGFMLTDMGNRLARKIDKDIWQGDGTTGNLQGIIPLLEADATVIDVVTTETSITAANVEEELGKFIDAHPDEVLQAPNHVFGVSTNVIRAIKRAYGTQARSNGTFLNPNEFDFEGYTLTEIKGLPANRMVGYNRDNIVIGMSAQSDFNEIRIKDMDEVDLSGQVRTKMVLAAGVEYAYGAEIVLYTPAA